MKHRLGACSWSLQAEALADLIPLIREVGVSRVQLGLDPLIHGVWSPDEVRESFAAAEIEIGSGMMGMKGEDYSSLASIAETGGIRPTKHWKANLRAANSCAEAAKALGLDLVSFHAGFLPHERDDPERARLIGRLRELADVFEARGVRVAFETGQESARTLLEVLEEIDRESVGVNFDPANMILYAMGDPVEALRTLSQRVFQIHIKDATMTRVPGSWGAEVPVGTGEVDWKAFFETASSCGLDCDLMIEREAGEQRVVDMRSARELLESLEVVELQP